MHQIPQKKRPLSLMLLSYLFLYGCSGGFSCGGESGSSGVSTGCLNNYSFPQSGLNHGADFVHNSAQLRMTDSALDFLESHIKEIMLAQLESTSAADGMIEIELPKTQITASVALGEGENEVYPTKLLIETSMLSEKMSIRLVEAGEQLSVSNTTHIAPKDGILVEFFDLPVGLDARLFTEVFKNTFHATAACQVVGTNPDYCAEDDSECGIFTGISVAMLVYPEIKQSPECDVEGTECLLLNTQILDAKLGSIGASALDIYVPPFDDDDCMSANAPENCSPECSDINFAESAIGWSPAWECTTICAVQEFGIDFMLGVASFIEPILASQLDNMMQTMIDNALKDIDGAPLSIANRFILADKLSGLPPIDSRDLGFAINPEENSFSVSCPDGNNCEAHKGMDLFFKTGLEAATDQESIDDSAAFGRAPHSCVKGLEDANFIDFFQKEQFAISELEALKGQYEGENYHFGLSLSAASIEQTLFALYNAGFLCFDATSDEVYQLSQGAFAIAAGSIDVLAGGQLSEFTDPSAPARLTLLPNEPPRVSFRKNDAGKQLIHLDWKNVDISFYTMAHQRFVRIFGVSVDLALDFEIVFDATTGLLKIVMENAPQITNYDEKYNELLPEEDFAEVLESLVALSLDAAFSDNISFDLDLGGPLGDALGFPLQTQFHGIEMLPENSPEFLQVYLSLVEAETESADMMMFVPQNNQSSHLWNSQSNDLDLNQRAMNYSQKSGSIRLIIPEAEASDLIYVQTDFGVYSGPFQVDDEHRIEFTSAKLNFPGLHQLSFKRRSKTAKSMMQTLKMRVQIRSDFKRPQVSLTQKDGHFYAQASDDSCDPSGLLYAWKLDDSPYGAFSDRNDFTSETKHFKRISVKVKDCSGKESFERTTILKTKSMK